MVPRVYRESVIIRKGQAVPLKNVTSKYTCTGNLSVQITYRSAILKWREVYPKLIENDYYGGKNLRFPIWLSAQQDCKPYNIKLSPV